MLKGAHAMADAKCSTARGGWIYAATDGHDVKIGYTTYINPEQRIPGLTGQGRGAIHLLQAVHVTDLVLRVETCVHQLLSEHHIRHEWFESDVLQTPLHTLVEQALVRVNQPVVRRFHTYYKKNPVVIDAIYHQTKK
jgi:Meiotically Up-regulated Gene 113 (MUG113) protein